MTITTILTDIEGTTTDIRFVHNVLFPYAREHLSEYLAAHWDDESLTDIKASARQELGEPNADIDRLTAAFIEWIDQDKKVTALKSLQGLIWVKGYTQGDFTGHLYPDAYEFLKRWKAQGISLNVFSSGSVKAQKLLFGFSDFGDLTPLFEGYFDTTSGHKREKGAYETIAKAIGVKPSSVLFLSDIQEELDAAQQAGMNTYLLERDEPIPQPRHPKAKTFDDIVF